MGLPWCSVVKNPPVSAGDTGSIPDLERPHVARSSEARAPQQRSPGNEKSTHHDRAVPAPRNQREKIVNLRNDVFDKF